MRHDQHDLENALRHIKELEQRIIEQGERIRRLRDSKQPTEAAESLQSALMEGLELLKLHLASMTGPKRD